MILDAHTHMPSAGWSGHSSFFRSVREAVEYLRAAGTTAAIFNTWQGVFAGTESDLVAGNEMALSLAREFDGFLYPAAVVHPDFPETSSDLLARFRDEGYLWVGELVPYAWSYAYTDRKFMRITEECARHGHIVQLHCSPDLVELAKRFTEVEFVNSHIPAQDTVLAMSECRNIWQDISGSAGGLAIGAVERAVTAYGVGRLLYGSDFDGQEPRACIARVGVAIAQAADRTKVFCDNLVGLLSKAGSRPIVS